MPEFTFPGYRIVEKIQDGSIGSIYKVADSSNNLFAVKLLSKANLQRSEKRGEFKKESKILQELSHPNLIKIFKYSEDPQPYFVMEYFPSKTLKYCITHEDPRFVGKEFSILGQLARALVYIHSKGITHRDIKPENVLVREDGTIKLIDFSISWTPLDKKLWFMRPKAQGTPVYMAPEQIQNKAQDERTDIYSFGIVIFEVLTRKPPFIGSSIGAVLSKHLSAQAHLSSLIKNIDKSLQTMVDRCLAKEKEQRPRTMQEVAFEIAKWENESSRMKSRQIKQKEI